MPYTLEQLSTIVDGLSIRMDNLDGQNLQDSSQSSIAQLNSKFNGLTTTVRQSVLKMEQLYNDLKTTVVSYYTLLKQHLGLP